MRREISALLHRCQQTPLKNVAKLSDEMTKDDREKIVVLLKACGDYSRAEKLGLCEKEPAQVRSGVRNERRSLEALIDQIENARSIKSKLLLKRSFDEELLNFRAVEFGLIERAFSTFQSLGLTCSNKHREKLVVGLFPNRWEEAMQIVGQSACLSPREVELAVAYLGSSSWETALSLARSNVLTSKSASIVCLLCASRNWEAALHVLQHSPAMTPKDGFVVQESLLRTSCNWESCFTVLGKLTNCNQNNALMAATHLVRRNRLPDALKLLNPFAPIPPVWVGFLVKNAEQWSREFARKCLSECAPLCSSERNGVVECALQIILGDLQSGSLALMSRVCEISSLVRWIAAHASCDGSESFEDYCSSVRFGKRCLDHNVARHFGEVAASIPLDDESQLCLVAVQYFEPLPFWKGFSRV